MSDDIVIRIKTLLDKASPTDIDKVKSDIEKRVNPKIKIDVDTNNLNKVKEKFEQAQGSVGGITQKTKEWSNALNETVKQTEYFKVGSEEVQKRVTETTVNLKKQRAEIEKINAEQSKYWAQRRKEVLDTMTSKPDSLKQLSDYYKGLEKESLNLANIEEKRQQAESKYWAQRRKETLNSMTSKPDELVKMAEYYKQLELTSNDFNKKNINAIDYEIQKREILAKQFSQSLQAKMLQETEEKKITNEIQKQNIEQQKLLNTIRGMRGINGAFITGDNLKDLNALENKIKGFNPADKDFAQNMRNAQLELQKINTTMGIYKKNTQDASKFTNVFGQSIFEAGKKFASWLLIGNTIMGAIRVIRDGIQFVVDLDNAMNQLQIVMSLTSEQAIELGRNYNTLAKEMSVTTTEIAKAAVEFARQGLSLSEMDDRLRNTIKYAKISGMEFQEAAEIITASVNSMGVETQRAIDIFSYMGDATATGKHMCPAA